MGETTERDSTWQDLLAQLNGADELTSLISEEQDPRARYELYRWVLLSLSQGYQLVAAADPQFPLWSSFFLNFPMPSHGCNPDMLYLSTVLEDAGIYRIWGTRGTTRLFSIQFGSPVNEPGAEGISKTYATYDIDTLTLDPDGAFEVVLSAERPADWAGDWWPMAPNTGFAFARFAAYDWEAERNGDLHIERLNPTSPRPMRKSADAVKAQLSDIVRFGINNARHQVAYVAGARGRSPLNSFKIVTMLDIGGWAEQRYWEGGYAIADDEALIVEITLPDTVAYWNVQITQETWETLDYFNRISSVNGAQAQLAADGKCYVVIAAQDPGVPNWLDTAGYNRGYCYGRWNRASSAPEPVTRLVKLTDLRAALPPDIPVVCEKARAAEITARRRAAQRRFRF